MPKPALRGRHERWRSDGRTPGADLPLFPVEGCIGGGRVSARDRGRWTLDLARSSPSASIPLEERVARVYGAYAEQDEGIGIRLLMRAALDGLKLPARRGAALTAQILEPLLVELRHEARLPTIDRTPLLPAERELALMLHAAIVQLGVREHIYRSPLPMPREAVIRLYAETFLREPGTRSGPCTSARRRDVTGAPRWSGCGSRADVRGQHHTDVDFKRSLPERV